VDYLVPSKDLETQLEKALMATLENKKNAPVETLTDSLAPKEQPAPSEANA
tara:strand:- start:341 stop:493 length:153 start_codon:yes stop_codon:yes gene_type:complete